MPHPPPTPLTLHPLPRVPSPRRRRHRRARNPSLTPAENGLERRHTRAGYGNGDLDHGPEVNEDAFAEGIDGHGVRVDGVQANDGGDRGKGADAEDEEEGVFLAGGPVDGAEGFDGEEEDPDVGYYVEG